MDHRITISNIALPTGHTAAISLSSEMFSQEYGPMLHYAILVAQFENGGMLCCSESSFWMLQIEAYSSDIHISRPCSLSFNVMLLGFLQTI